MFRVVAAALILLVSAWSPATADAKRVALVIGMGPSLPTDTVLTDPATAAEARSALQQLGFIANTNRGGDDQILEDAIKRFQTKAGLTPDGQLTSPGWHPCGSAAWWRSCERRMASLRSMEPTPMPTPTPTPPSPPPPQWPSPP